ncbi:efflux RND transporter periplasmic adaptor subunit [Paludisphaera mucosa]|uniref:Efflux RND transporter periplasmic adaptor subunit n=1 Tax=Paludisphaera mucosa TaxID=3030827 RepID=A0ABT6FGR5_9BACT|nr:efflux RND transporter periplasmic adaptor subunit [Paludisphaera mucosa]MDG3006709.1 efflux RND transporter periplasmic adaptor subunit [Paludisphaera mucosa]
MNRRVSFGLAMLACGCVAGCGSASSSTSPAARPPDLVLFDKPITREVLDFETFPGRTEAVMSVEIRARVSGYLNQVYFQDGQHVEKDGVLFQIDARPFQSAVDRTQAALEQAEAHAKRCSNEYQRAKVLYDRGLSISREEYDRYAFDHAESVAAIGTAKAAHDLALLDLEFTRVTSPIGGRLGRRLVDPGNLVQADTTALTSVVSQDPIYVYFDVHEAAMLRIRRLLDEGKVKADGDKQVPVEIGLSDEKEYRHKGLVDFTDNRVDLNTGTLRFRARLDNPTGLFTPGLFVRVKLPIGEPHKALMIREEALTSDQGQKKVYVLRRAMKDGKPAFFEDKTGKPLANRDGSPIPKFNHTLVGLGQIGVLVDGFREVSEGLQPDDMVVVSGLQKLRKDSPVAARAFESEADATAAKPAPTGPTAPVKAPDASSPAGSPAAAAPKAH